MQLAEDLAYQPVGEAAVTAVASHWSSDRPGVRIGDHLVYVLHRPVEPGVGTEPSDAPLRARYKVHAAPLGDRTRLVTLIVHVQGERDLGLHETVVSTEPGGCGRVLARGFGRRDQPVILVFRLESEVPSLASA